MQKGETIAAISGGMTVAGIGIVRISGPEAIPIAARVYRGRDDLQKAESHTIHYGKVVEKDRKLDQALFLLFRAPRSYTGEDTVEIDCHGGHYVTQRVLEAVLAAGARLARPGEFTQRAFLNGRMDLSQAEAVLDVIGAENAYALESSLQQLEGSLREEIQSLRGEILEETAYIEAALDDPEHISLEDYGKILEERVEGMQTKIQALLASYDQGRILKEGIQTVILGKPNAGKSSLLNSLSGRERAIVTDIPGTTRDTLEESIRLGGLPLHLVDTAGLRKAQDPIEQIGVEKARKEAKKADLLLYLVDASHPLDGAEADVSSILGILKTGSQKVILLLNKTDLEAVVTQEDLQKALLARCKTRAEEERLEEIPILSISAKEGTGLDRLGEVVEKLFLKEKPFRRESLYLSNARQKEALQEAEKALERVLLAIAEGLPEDFYTIDLLEAYSALGKITGETLGEDLIHEIFGKFCMGK